jgi:uncharacterized membrane protein
MRRPSIGRLLIGILYLTTGTLHFIHTATYVAIMPPYLPAHRTLVFLSGAAEIGGGLGILIPATQRAAAWGLVALLIAVMPANIYMVTDHTNFPEIPLWAVWLRLPLQLPLIYWAWLYTRTSESSLRRRTVGSA